jgi:hypothetical protein
MMALFSSVYEAGVANQDVLLRRNVADESQMSSNVVCATC